MDINKDDILSGTEVSEETTVTEDVTESIAEDMTEEVVSEEVTSTLDVSQDDIDDEMSKYGAYSEDDASEDTETVEETVPVRKPVVQKTIIIATVAILVAAIVLSSVVLIYNAFFKPGISGAYVLSEAPDSGTYFVFDKDGNVSMDGGGIRYFGTYEMQNVNGVDVITSDFYFIASYGGQAAVTFSDNKQVMTLAFPAGTLEFVKTKLPELKVDPKNITHASADELGITEPNIVDGIVGTWTEEMYGTYTFNADGTGTYLSEYSFSEYMGYGLGMEYNFKYTVYEDEILITLDYYGGQKEDGSFAYYLDKGNLVLNGVGYTKVDK